MDFTVTRFESRSASLYGDARLELVLHTSDGSVVDIEDEDQLASYVVVGQNVEPNSPLKVTYKRDSEGKEYSNLVESMSYKKITLTLKKVNLIPEEIPEAPPVESLLPETTAAPITEKYTGEKHTDDDFTYVVLNDGTAAIVGYNGDDKTVSIPSELNEHEVSVIGPGVFEGHTEITSMAIWADPKTISERAFMGCTGLKEISISSDTELIGASAFEGCSKLKSVLLWGDPDIGARAFYGCTALKEISIGSDTESIGESAFEGCTGLKSVLLWGEPNIEERAFSGCIRLKEISIGYDTEYIGDYAFYGCTSLESAIIWDDDTEIGVEAFGNCPNVEITQ